MIACVLLMISWCGEPVQDWAYSEAGRLRSLLSALSRVTKRTLQAKSLRLQYLFMIIRCLPCEVFL